MSFSNPNTQYLIIKPPLRGSFPLDHDHICQPHVLEFINCVKGNRGDSQPCRDIAKKYFECRMENELMEKGSLEDIGFFDGEGVINVKQSGANGQQRAVRQLRVSRSSGESRQQVCPVLCDNIRQACYALCFTG